MERLEEIRERLEDGVTYNSDAKSDIEWLLKALDTAMDSMVVYKLGRVPMGLHEISKDLAADEIAVKAADSAGTGTSRHDWYGEDDA